VVYNTLIDETLEMDTGNFFAKIKLLDIERILKVCERVQKNGSDSKMDSTIHLSLMDKGIDKE
jgi:hypothetical protein